MLALLATSAHLTRFGGDAAAQTTAGPPPTRVVFAIDNSGSMFGVGGEPASDPDQQRIEGVRGLIGVLRGFLTSDDEQRVVELGALSFGGGEPQVLSELTTVLDEQLPTRLRAERIGGGTDFRAGLCSAWTLAAREAPPTSAGCPEPSPDFLRAVGAGGGQGEDSSDGRLLAVLITDGSPAPVGADLLFDGNPPAAGCPRGYDGYDAGDGDAYLCALAATWQALRAERAVDLVVIGLDEPGQWFPAAEAYWQRVVQCGGAGQPACTDRVVRSVDAGRLAELILRTFPGVDLCELIPAGDTFNCSVPGGLVSVRFQIVGLTAGSTSTVGNPDQVTYESIDNPSEFTTLGESAHVWRFERPGAGFWALTLSGDVPPGGQVSVIVDPDPATFDIEVRSWDERGLTLGLQLHPTGAGRVAVASLLTQPYGVELLRDGLIIDEGENLYLEHEGGEAFALTAAFEPPRDSVMGHEVVLYLRTLLVGRLRLTQLPQPTPSPAATPAPTPVATVAPTPVATPAATPATTPAPTPVPAPTPPPCSEFGASWEGEAGSAPRWRPALRLGFPLPIRFRDSAIWSVTIDSPDCAEPIEGDARVVGCTGCAASDEGRPPLPLDVPTDGLSGDSAPREVGWYAPSSGVEGLHRENDVRLDDSWLLYWEPVWALALHLLVLVALAVGVSVAAVRLPHAWGSGEEPARPIELAVPDEDHRPVDVVRLGTFVWRRTLPGEHDAAGGRLLTLRWLICGELVARDTRDGAAWRDRWLGVPTAELGAAEFGRLDIRRRPRHASRP